MRLILAIPDLLAQDPATLAAAPALARLAHYAGTPSTRSGGLDGWLVNVSLNNDAAGDDGTAPLAALGAGFDPGASWVMRADPVSLVAGRADVSLAARIDDLDAGDANAMIAMLNEHFGRDGLAFHAPRPDAWFVTPDATPDMATTPLSAVHGAIYPFLPSGNDAGKWRRWMSEMQMLLHEHPANAAREAQGRVRVTGIWIADGGRIAQGHARQTMATFAPRGSTGDVARGLARSQGQAAGEPPADFAAMKLASDESGSNALVVLDRANAGAMARLETTWLRPAVAALERGTLTAFCLLADGDGLAARWNATPPKWLERVRAKFAPRPLGLPPFGSPPFGLPTSARDDD